MKQVFLTYPVITHIVAVIRAKHDHGVIHAPAFSEIVKQASELVIQLFNQAHVNRRNQVANRVTREALAHSHIHPCLHQWVISFALSFRTIHRRQIPSRIHVVIRLRCQIRPVRFDVTEMAKPRLITLCFHVFNTTGS